MNLFSNLFNSKRPSEEGNQEQIPKETLSIDELFISNFTENGGKFLYCENLNEIREQFENILEENDWFESEVLCNEPDIFFLLNENKLIYTRIINPKFFLTDCENIIAQEGTILFSSNQIRENKPDELPKNIVVFATTSQLVPTKNDAIVYLQKKYKNNLPSNITSIKHFEKPQLENSPSSKNLYLLLLEDL